MDQDRAKYIEERVKKDVDNEEFDPVNGGIGVFRDKKDSEEYDLYVKLHKKLKEDLED